MADYRANNTITVVAIIVIVLIAALVLYYVFGGERPVTTPAPAPVVPEVETRVELPPVTEPSPGQVPPPEQAETGQQ